MENNANHQNDTENLSKSSFGKSINFSRNNKLISSFDVYIFRTPVTTFPQKKVSLQKKMSRTQTKKATTTRHTYAFAIQFSYIFSQSRALFSLRLAPNYSGIFYFTQKLFARVKFYRTIHASFDPHPVSSSNWRVEFQKLGFVASLVWKRMNGFSRLTFFPVGHGEIEKSAWNLILKRFWTFFKCRFIRSPKKK